MFVHHFVKLLLFLGKNRFMVLHHGCIYYFKETDSNAPKGKFPLNGFRYSTLFLDVMYICSNILVVLQKNQNICFLP